VAVVRSERAFAGPPNPGRAGTLDELIESLRLLKVWGGNPSYDTIKDRINADWTKAGRPGGELAKRATVADCFKTGRRRLNSDLVIAVVQALHPQVGYVTLWRQALRVIGGETVAAAQVRVQDTLPQDLAEFTGRSRALDQIRRALHEDHRGDSAVVILAGMAGVGKTQIAVHAGHLLAREKPLDRVLFVNLRGFHPDPARPPADPAAVLDGFLRLLGMPGQQIPHDLPARTAAYRRRLAGTHTLIVLDNAADADQIRPLLPETPGCPVLITSRRSLTTPQPATHVAVDAFTPDEAADFLTKTAPRVPAGPDPDATARIARRCGHLPLALGLVAGHIRVKPGWTLTDHADRLDERHHDRRLDTGVELAFDVSYQHLPPGGQRLLRLLALHPGQDFDTHAAAALAGTDLPSAEAYLRDLCRNHLLQQPAPDRYTLHDLVRAYATSRATDEDPPPERHAALTRLFDLYLATAAAAMDTLYPAETHRRTRIPPAVTPAPALTDPDAARAWLDTERPTLVTIAGHTAAHGWPTHAIRLSTTLFRYLNGGHHSDALTVHGHALHAAQHTNDPVAQANALTNLGAVYLWLTRYKPATEHLQRALALFRQTDDPVCQARAWSNLGNIEVRTGHYQPAAGHYEHALALFRQADDPIGEARALGNLGVVEERLGRYRPAAEHYQQALTVSRQAGDRTGEADAQNDLGVVEIRLGRYRLAGDHFQQALALFQQLGDREGEASTLHGLGTLHTHLSQPAKAIEHYEHSLAICREVGDRDGEAWALNGLGEAARAAGRPTDALAHHTAAHTVAADIGNREQQARAHTNLGLVYSTLVNPDSARQHYQHALTLYTNLGMPEADQVRAHLTTIDNIREEQREGRPYDRAGRPNSPLPAKRH